MRKGAWLNKMIFTIIGFLLAITALGFILAWIANYIDGRHGCDTHISFEAFRTFYSRFPDKWRLRNNYIEFIIDCSYGTYLNVYFKNPIDLLHYQLYYTSIRKQKSRARENANYNKLIDAFEKLNEWEKKHG